MKKTIEYKWTEIEEWYDIHNFEGLYQLSNHLKVKSLSRIIETKPGSFFTKKESILKQSIGSRGHLMVSLYNKNSKNNRLSLGIHILVAEMFLDNPDNLILVEHIDDNPLNNNPNNLMWSTESANQIKSKYVTDTKELKPVEQFDKQGNYIKSFESLALAYKSINKNANCGNIGQCCIGKIKNAYGFIWKYKTETI